METQILDPCCGSRMMWFDPKDQRCLFGDQRHDTVVITDRSHGKDGTRTVHIHPDAQMDFRALPFADGSFVLVAFDPPHLVRAGPRSWMAAKYGKLGKDWREDMRQGFAECFRVLRPHGVLIFKWNETQIPLDEILACTDHKPLFGQRMGRQNRTHWMTFIKPGDLYGRQLEQMVFGATVSAGHADLAASSGMEQAQSHLSEEESDPTP